MNKIRLNSICALATLLVIVLLAGCTRPTEANPPADPTTPAVVATTPPPTVDVQPTPTIEPTAEAAPEGSNSEPEADAPAPEAEWTQESFGEAWTIGYPAGWAVNRGGVHEGYVDVQGEFGGHSYAVTFAYPIGILVQPLDEWIEEYLAPLTPEQRQALVVSDVTVANTPAKKVLNYSAGGGATIAHQVYLWRSEGKNPRLITINQIDDQPLDAVAMEQLLDQFLTTIQ